MCVVAVAAVAGVALAAYSQHQQGQAQKQAEQHNARLDRYNAGLQDMQAADAVNRGAIAAGQSLQGTARDVAQGRVAFASGNVDVGVGAPVLWEADALSAGYEDAALIRYNAAQEARGFRGAAFNSRSSAALRRSSGRNAARAGNIQAAGSLLAGASQISAAFPRTTAPASRGVLV